MDDILIYTKDPGQGHVKAVRWVLGILTKNNLLANLKKCWFHKDQMQFLGYVISSQGIQMKDKKIKAVRNFLKLKLVQVIYVFINFANFYQRFIRDFSRVVAPLTSLLKITGSSNLALRKLEANEVVRGSGKADDRNLLKFKKSKNAKPGI